MCVLSRFSCVWLFATPWTDSAKLLCPWDSPGKNTGVGYPALLQGIFQPRGQNRVSCHSCLTGGFSTAEPPGKTKIKKTRYILVQLWYGRWHISWRWHLNILWLGDIEMNFGIREAWIKFKLWLFLWENYLVSLHLCFPSIKPPLSIVVGLRDSFVHSRIYSVIKCLLNIG